MPRLLSLLGVLALAYAQSGDSSKQAAIARAKSLELNTPYVAPPGNPLVHHAAGYAKVVCSAVFVSGFDPEFAAENLGYFVAPYAERKRLGKPVVDRTAKTVRIDLPDGTSRTARHLGDQGCVTLPLGRDSVYFTPVKLTRPLPNPATQPWPMGDAPARRPLPEGVDTAKVARAVAAAFELPQEMTAAFLVTWKGQIVGERYGEGVRVDTPLEGWSMGKSIVATLLGILVKEGVYELSQPAPIPEWNAPDDPRRAIRIADIMHMSSGLRIRAPQDPDYDASKGYPDHVYLYTGSENLFHYAATRPQQWPPNIVGRYRNTDPVLISYLIRLAVEKRKQDYLTFPQRALFDKLGIRTMVLETDAYGNFLTQGYELASARDWARLGNLYLQDGMWEGQRILPEGFVNFVSSPAPAWKLDGQPEYGGFFWINGLGRFPIPKDAYFMAGAGNQFTIIVPSHDLVVVRLGHFKGAESGFRSLQNALALLMEAIPKKR
jgi:CubicO group peptidase (beta-lactamase class C family)